MQWPLARRRPRTFQNFNLAAVMDVLRDLGESRPGRSASIRSENDPSQLGKVAGWGRRQDLRASRFKAGTQTGNALPPASVPQTGGKRVLQIIALTAMVSPRALRAIQRGPPGNRITPPSGPAAINRPFFGLAVIAAIPLVRCQ
jgi:hypothetical protein